MRQSMHSIAHDLGYTVSELADRMTYSEFKGWCIWYKERNKDGDSKGGTVNLDEMTPEQVAEFMGS